jgi:hypothetical protein
MAKVAIFCRENHWIRTRPHYGQCFRRRVARQREGKPALDVSVSESRRNEKLRYGVGHPHAYFAASKDAVSLCLKERGN